MKIVFGAAARSEHPAGKALQGKRMNAEIHEVLALKGHGFSRAASQLPRILGLSP